MEQLQYVVVRLRQTSDGVAADSLEYVDGLSKGPNDEISVHYGTTPEMAFRFSKRSTAARVVQSIISPGMLSGIVVVQS